MANIERWQGELSAREAKTHAPWCSYDHEGGCPAENAPPPEHPVWVEVESLRQQLRGAVAERDRWQDEAQKLRVALDRAQAVRRGAVERMEKLERENQELRVRLKALKILDKLDE